MTNDVWVVLYTHKHGTDGGVYSTYAKALEAGVQIAYERVEEGCWEEENREFFLGLEDNGRAIDFFNDVESSWSYSEYIELLQRPLG